MRFILLSIFVSFNLGLFSQQVELLKNLRFPAQPYGGIDEVQALVNQQINYPLDEYNSNTEGVVFVLVKIDSLGKLVSKKAIGDVSKGLKEEALRLASLIYWESDRSRESHKIGEEKIKFTFSKKKFDKVVRKRGYKAASTSSVNVFDIKHLDSIPEILKYKDLNEYTRKNIKYPSLALQQGISGNVTTEFVIEPNGKISNIRIVKAVAGGCNEETTRLLRATTWKPGFKDGSPVRTFYKYSLRFIHPGNTYR